MTDLYRLATFIHRGYSHVGVEVQGHMVELGQAYEHFKRATGQRDLFKARHNYTMMDVLEEWDLFVPIFDRMVEFYRPQLSEKNVSFPFVYEQDEIKFLPPITPQKVLNAAANYYDHALEMGAAAPDHDKHDPYFFYKGSSHVLIGHGDTIVLPARTKFVDYEAELAVVIGKQARNVPVERALDYVAGYSCYNDVSGRDMMRRKGESFDYDWFACKGNDTFGPLGPYIVPRKFIRDPQNLAVKCFVSGELMQDTNTKHMVFNAAEQIAYISSVTTLSPGDVIATGTGAGVGMAKNIKVQFGEMHKVLENMFAGNARMLRPGDTVVVEVEGVGRLENKVAAA